MEAIKLSDIVLDKQTQPRAVVDDYTVNEYRLDMMSGDEFPPLVVFRNGNDKYYLADGWHRYHAKKQIDPEGSIGCTVIDGGLRAAILFSCGVNQDHGKRRTNGDKERAVKKLLSDPEWALWSDHEIARKCRVTHPFVGKVRSSLVTVTSEKRIYTTKHGTQATMETSKIGNTERADTDSVDMQEAAADQPSMFTAAPSSAPEPSSPKPVSKYDPKSYDLFVSPIEILSTYIAHNSIDCIITDPPYPKEYIPLFKELAEQASVVLKPHGILVAMCGHNYIGQLIKDMSEHLKYHWLGCYYMPSGPHASLQYYKVSVYWKPLLIFSKGDWPKTKVFRDVFVNSEADKQYHKWGQGISGFKEIISAFTLPNETVLDPFVGGGTTAIAALELGRYFKGSDISADEVDKTRTRLEVA